MVAFDAEFLLTLVLNPLIKKRTYLLEKVNKVDNAEGARTRFKDLKEALPAKIKTIMLKVPMVDIAVQVWVILGKVITNKAGMLSSNVEEKSGLYFTNCEAALKDEMKTTIEKTSKMPVGEEIHRYLKNGATKPKSHPWLCSHCEGPYTHKPPSNKVICVRNKARLEKYTHLNKELNDYNNGCQSEINQWTGKGRL
jgi:hypothetical protein